VTHLRGGCAAGLCTAIGCAAGLFIHAVAVAVGLAQLLLRSETAFEVVKFTGALMLIVLGGRSLWSVWRACTLVALGMHVATE
jgi:threonine/homoserine/homoserine lactone efflux protein